MAEPVVFEEANTDLRGGDTGAMDIRVWQNPKERLTIVCWALSPEELTEVQKTGRVWTSTTGLFPPMNVMGKNPFVRGSAADELMVLRDKATSLTKIDELMSSLNDSFFSGDNVVAETLRTIREEASHAR